MLKVLTEDIQEIYQTGRSEWETLIESQELGGEFLMYTVLNFLTWNRSKINIIKKQYKC